MAAGVHLLGLLDPLYIIASLLQHVRGVLADDDVPVGIHR